MLPTRAVCGSLADGSERYPREGDTCDCKPGWGGINCNCASLTHSLYSHGPCARAAADVRSISRPPAVCETDEACDDLVGREPAAALSLRGGAKDDDDDTAVCYKEGYGVKEMYQMCNVTSASPSHSPSSRSPESQLSQD